MSGIFAGCPTSVTLLLVAIFVLATQAPAQAKELHIAAAADLQPVLPKLAAEYEHQTGIKIVASYGSSATLTQQLSNGDPQDVFLSADTAHPQQLVVAGLADDPVPVAYARGVLVLWARKDSLAQPLSLDSLKSPRVTRIAIANDQHAPYGLAARRALKALNLEATVNPKLAIAENIMQTAQFAESGNAQLALISLTIASSPHFQELGTFVRMPNVYGEIKQSGVVLNSSTHKNAAHDFLRWLSSPNTQQKLANFGLDPAS